VKATSLQAKGAVDRDDLQTSGFKQLKRRSDVFRRLPEHSGHHVHDLGEVDRADPRPTRDVTELAFDGSRCWLVQKQRDERLCIEDRQRGAPRRLASASASS